MEIVIFSDHQQKVEFYRKRCLTGNRQILGLSILIIY